jgi:hypothetical protein
MARADGAARAHALTAVWGAARVSAQLISECLAVTSYCIELSRRFVFSAAYLPDVGRQEPLTYQVLEGLADGRSACVSALNRDPTPKGRKLLGQRKNLREWWGPDRRRSGLHPDFNFQI